MTIKTETFARRPFLVEAVRVSSTNMTEAAEWCGGEIRSEKRGNRTVQHIYVEGIPNAKSDRQKKAYVGDFLLMYGKGFKIYTPKAFDDCFEEPSEKLLEMAGILARHDVPLPELEALGQKYAPGQV